MEIKILEAINFMIPHSTLMEDCLLLLEIYLKYNKSFSLGPQHIEEVKNRIKDLCRIIIYDANFKYIN